MSLLGDFASLFYPVCCLACDGALVKGEEQLCTKCLSDLPRTHYPDSRQNPVAQKLAGRLPLTHAFAYLKFRKGGIVQHLLHQLKYNDHPELGIGLGRLFGATLTEQAKDFDLVIPVPLHDSRKRKRGYNQSAKIAEGLSDSLKIPWDESISFRTSSNMTQTRKSRIARWENVKDVFAASARKSVKGRRILLIDDVITTGATLEACGRHLLDQGCSELSVACLAEAQ